MLVLSKEDVEDLLGMDDYIEVLEEGYKELGRGQAISRPRSDVSVPLFEPEEGKKRLLEKGLVPEVTTPLTEFEPIYRFKSMEGGIIKLGVYAIRINSDVVTFPFTFGKRRQVKIPAAKDRFCGFVLLFEMGTGIPLALFPDGVVQRMRVGATNGIAAKYLARKNSKIIGLIGSGWQAGSQLMALTSVRNISEVRVYSPNPEHRVAFAKEMSRTLGIDIHPVDDPRTAVKGADIVSLATTAMVPAFKGEWLEEGMHLCLVNRREVDDETYRRSDVIITHARIWGWWRAAGYYPYLLDWVLGDRKDIPLLSLFASKDVPIDWEQTPDLADVALGKTPGRTDDKQITFFCNNIGLGMQFAAAGARLYQKAKERAVGHEIPTDWFLQKEHT